MWARILNSILGLWLMIAPGILGFGPAASDNGHIIGPVVITFAIIAMWEATRVLRKWNYPLAIWLLLAPWVLQYDSTIAIMSDVLTGVCILIFVSVKGNVEKTYGGGWSSLWKNNSEDLLN